MPKKNYNFTLTNEMKAKLFEVSTTTAISKALTGAASNPRTKVFVDMYKKNEPTGTPILFSCFIGPVPMIDIIRKGLKNGDKII